MAISSYDISPDGNDIVFAAVEAGRETKVWQSRADRREPPRPITRMQASGPVFGDARTVYFRGVEGGFSYLFRADLATGATEKFRPEPVVNSPTISPDRKWVVVMPFFEGRGPVELAKAYPVQGGDPVALCRRCFVSWSRDASTMYFTSLGEMGSLKTLAVPLRGGKMFPALPEGGIATLLDGKSLPGARVIDRMQIFPGPTPELYAYMVETAHRNLYRIRK